MVEHGVEESVCCGSHVRRVMTRSDDTDVGGTFCLVQQRGAVHDGFPLCEPVQGVQDCTRSFSKDPCARVYGFDDVGPPTMKF